MKPTRKEVLEDADTLAQLLSYALDALDVVAHKPMQCEYDRTLFASKVYHILKPLARELIIANPQWTNPGSVSRQFAKEQPEAPRKSGSAKP